MSKRKKQKRKRHERRNEEPQKLTTKQRWAIVVSFALLFGLSLVPYAMDLVENPDLGNAVLLITVAGACIAVLTVILKYH